jgi:hypothetical protein
MAAPISALAPSPRHVGEAGAGTFAEASSTFCGKASFALKHQENLVRRFSYNLLRLNS